MKLFNTIAALAVVAVPLTAGAQQNTTLTFNLSGLVNSTCGVFNRDNPASDQVDVDFGDLVPVGSSTVAATRQTRTIVYVCNNDAGFSRRISSRNNGFLRSGGGQERRIDYTLSHVSARSELDFDPDSLSSPIVTTDLSGAARAFIAGVEATLTFDIPGGESVLSGTYTDVLTLEVNSN